MEIKQPSGFFENNANTKYIMDRGGVELLITLLNGVTPDGDVITEGVFKDIFLNSSLNSDVVQAIYSIRRYPFDVLHKEESETEPGNFYGVINGFSGTGDKLDPSNPNATMLKAISIANKTSTVKGSLDGVECGAYGAVMGQYNNIIRVAENIEVPPIYNNFLDYAPYTSVEVYLPFYGFVSLNPNECVGRSLNVYYVIDFNTGTATSYIVIASVTGEEDVVLDVRTFNIAIDVPLSQSNMADIKRSDFLAGMRIGQDLFGGMSSSTKVGKPSTKGLMSGAMAIPGLAFGVSEQLVGNVPRFSKGNTASSVAGLYGPQKCSVVVTRPVPIVSENYNKIHGRPVEVEDVLEEYLTPDAYLLCGDVHLEGFTKATVNELSMIENALKNGVIG